MGSSRGGVEGDPARVATLLAGLADLGVFEVAFGGGEPTLWPAFTDTLAYTRSLGIVPNFTTKNYTWLATEKATRWFDLVGSVAFSVNTRTAMDRLIAKAEAGALRWSDRRKITVQLIPDLVPLKDFEYIITQAAQRYWRVTLLGYKTTGRGGEFTPRFRRKAGSWLKTCVKVHAEHPSFQVAIDTLLAEQSHDTLAAAGVPPWMYHLQEGRFSAYVDAVTSRIGPSSYCDPSQLTDLELTGSADLVATRVNTAFATYLPTAALEETAQVPA